METHRPHVLRQYEVVPAELVRKFEGVAASAVFSAAEGVRAMAPRVKPIVSGMRVCGTALTVQGSPGDNLILHRALDICRPGEVIVGDFTQSQEAVWGGHMSMVALSRHCGGVVVDAAVRDVAELRCHGLPIFGIGVAITGTTKKALGLINHPIVCGGATVCPGDLVIGDDDGVCIVRRDHANAALAAIKERELLQRQYEEHYADGQSMWEVLDLRTRAAELGLREEQKKN